MNEMSLTEKQRMDRKLGEAIVAASPAMFAYIKQLAARGDAEAIRIVERVDAWALAPSIDKS